MFVPQAFIERALRVATTVADRDRSTARRIVGALASPFALYARDDARLFAQLEIAAKLNAETIVNVLAPVEPNVPWRRDVLLMRRAAYAATKHRLLQQADDDVRTFLAGEPMPVARPCSG